MASDCCAPVCAVVQTVSVPGLPGDAGAAGTPGSDGQNAYTLVAAPGFTNPAPGASISIPVGNNSFMAIGMPLFIQGGGYYSLVSKTGLTLITATFTNTGANTPFLAAVVPAGAIVTGSGNAGASLASITVLTDNTTGTVSNTLAVGAGTETLMFPIQLAAMTAAAADLLTNYVVGYAFKILSVSFATTTIGAGAAATMTLNLEINATNLTGGVVTITLAGTDTLGELTAGSAVTAANVGTATDTLSIEVAAGGTIFTAGAGVLLVKVQNMDSANALASIAAKVNEIRAAFP